MGLFRRAIVQSGSGLGAFTTEQDTRVTRAAAETLGIEPRADAFAEVSDERLLEAASRLAGIDLQIETHGDPLVGLSPFSLVLDAQPAQSVAAGPSTHIDLLIGTNTEEGNLYLVPVGKYSTSTATDVDAEAARSHPNPAQLVETYRKAGPTASFGELRSAILGDALFDTGSWALAEAHAARPESATFCYEFAWRSHALDGKLGATHTMELPFVFDVSHLPRLHGPDGLLGPDEPPRTSPPACTTPGSGSPPPATPAGTSTTTIPGPRCASTPNGPGSTTLAARNDWPGPGPPYPAQVRAPSRTHHDQNRHPH